MTWDSMSKIQAKKFSGKFINNSGTHQKVWGEHLKIFILKEIVSNILPPRILNK